MRIGRLKRRADELVTQARSDRRQFKSHAEQALAIVRRRMGSTAGLAVCFSLGFMAGIRPADGRSADAGSNRSDGAGSKGRRPTFMLRLVQGPVGEAAMKLGMALLTRSLMKLQEDDAADASAAVGTGHIVDRTAGAAHGGNHVPEDPAITSGAAVTGSSVK